MNVHLLFELFDLFSREALATDERGDSIEADRLWGIAHELYERSLKEPEALN